MKQRTRRSASWLALIAMALHALWPLAAAAMSRAAIAQEICSVTGTSHGSGDTGTLPASPGYASHDTHCASCAAGSGGFAVPGLRYIFPVRIGACTSVHSKRLPVLPESPPYSRARPRSPPALS